MKYYGLDLLRGIAAFGIVGCHLGLAQRTTGGEWVTVLCNFNVGLFAAISGFLMNAGGGGDIYEKGQCGYCQLISSGVLSMLLRRLFSIWCWMAAI